MRAILLLLALMLLMPLNALGETADTVTILVATDLHYLAPELTDHGPFFEQKITRGDGKALAYSEELVEAFVEQVIHRQPDMLILSGDLTLNGELASHQSLAAKLERIRAAGIPVLVMPGNHDLNNRGAVRYVGEGYERVDTVTAEDFRAIYQDFGYDGAFIVELYSNNYSDISELETSIANLRKLLGACGEGE